MQNIVIGRYGPNEGSVVPVGEEEAVTNIRRDWQGWIEPDDRSWIAFIRADGVPIVYLDRNPETGAILT